MIFANLMASVLALAMVGASTASVSKVDNNSVGSSVVLNRDLHKAYYDPDETYGTNGFVGYNYSSLTIHPPVFSDDEPYPITGFDDNFSWDSTHPVDIGFPSAVSGVSYYLDIMFDGGSIDVDRYGFEGLDADDSLDLYLDGDFVGTYTPVDYQGVYVFRIIIESSVDLRDDDHYVWVFDHSPVEPYTPVDILGDIAEGLTGGIVPVAEGIGNGLQSLVQDIFLNADHDGLSVFGIVIVCFAGLALALGLSRWVLNFVDTLGARDR